MLGAGETALFHTIWSNNFVHKKTGILQIVRLCLSEEPGAYSFLEERPGAVQLLEQIASMRSQLTSRSDYSTLMDTVASAFASSTLWISLPCLTTTKNRFSGTGLFGVLATAAPVQFGLTV